LDSDINSEEKMMKRSIPEKLSILTHYKRNTRKREIPPPKTNYSVEAYFQPTPTHNYRTMRNKTKIEALNKKVKLFLYLTNK
jgi:hypothetical protein